MTWTIATALMFVCSVVTYLTIRNGAVHKLPTQFNNLAMFGVPLINFLLFDIFSGQNLGVRASHIIPLLATGVLLSYLGNASSLKSIELAPNPGYSLIIAKSYVLMTSFLAVPLFGAHLPAQALLAILFIVGFSALILINPKQDHKAKANAWLPLAVLAFFCWGFLSLAAKYFFTHGMPTVTFLTYLFVIVTPCILAEMFKRQVSFKPVKKHFGSFLLIGLSSTGFNIFNFQAIRLAPNVGFVNATNASSIAAVTVLSILIFHDEFSKRKLIGVFGVVAGLFLLFLG